MSLIREATVRFKFVGAQERNPAVRRRRRLDAKRARDYRLRRKAKQSIDATSPRTESSCQAFEPGKENRQAGSDSTPADTREFEQEFIPADDISVTSGHVGEGSDAHSIEQDPYGDEEPVSLHFHCTEDSEAETEPQVPETYAEQEAGLPDGDTWSDVEYTTEKFIQQFLVGIYGCRSSKHREDLATHIETEGTHNHHRLDQLFSRNVPHTLDKPFALSSQVHHETMRLNPNQWQELFSGHIPQRFEDKPKQACLHTEHSQHTPPVVSFDIDSILGFVTSPATAVHGIQFYSAPQYVQNISTDVHLTLDRVDPDPERPRLIPSRLKDVPHFIFARAEGADFITFHLFIPHLPCSRNFNRLMDEQLSRWFDDIFYPAVRQVYDVDRLQHLPASYRHALATCRAPKVEDRLLETPSYRTQLRITYFLPPQGLQQLWDRILAAVRQPGLQDFRDLELFIEAKGTKLLFKYPDAPSDLLAVMENFDCKLHHVLDFSYICSDRLYIDVGKETCPLQDSVPSPKAQTYLWRRCCIHAGGMTTLTPPTSRLRRGGILYGQMYSLTKEIVDAARTFPFQNPDLRHLALDPQLRNGVQSIYGKPVSGKDITDRAYLASKRRCHYGLTDSKQRSFGIREEYRISWTLFQSVLTALRSLAPEARSIKLPGSPTHLWAIRSSAFVNFVWHNIYKFTTGFELVQAQCSAGLTTWEQTKIMDMFLRCLRVAVGGHDYSREGALCTVRPWIWPDIRAILLIQSYLGMALFINDISNMMAMLGISLTLVALCHICLQQMRADVLHSIQGDLRPKVRTTILDDHVQFWRKGLSATLVSGMNAVSGNRASVKSPQEVDQALFGSNDSIAISHAGRTSTQDQGWQAPVAFYRYPGRKPAGGQATRHLSLNTSVRARMNGSLRFTATSAKLCPNGHLAAKKIDVKQYLKEVDLRSTQVVKKRPRLMLPDVETGGEPNGKWTLIDKQRTLSDSTNTPDRQSMNVSII
ncbi:hypothetical protein HZ326_19302 [Fusarium oxysporum f. sp. albedinis]|nr:hypothetical protein HZ326_19302 [Fusarium oxysporum f. sp. albedinis]